MAKYVKPNINKSTIRNRRQQSLPSKVEKPKTPKMPMKPIEPVNVAVPYVPFDPNTASNKK